MLNPVEKPQYQAPKWQKAADFEDILYHKAEGIARLSFNRPEVHNAFRPQTTDEMIRAFHDAWEDPEVGVIVITGEGGKAFCSGGDQRVRGEAGYVGSDGVPRLNVLTLQRMIRTCPKPVIASVAGWAIGGGHVLHVVCDLTIAAENARFGQTGPKVGSFDGGFGASYLASHIGQKKAREIWYLCRQYDAQQALDMGMVNTVVPLEKLEEETVTWAREILQNSPIAIRCIKAGLNAELDGQAGVQELAGNATMLFYMTEEGQEGKRAFLEKRKPDFSKFPGYPDHESLRYPFFPGGLVPEPALPAPGSFFAWIAAARLKTLPAGAAPVMVGTAVAAAEGHFSALPALAALLGALWIQVGTNFANDLFDYLKGADTEERAGPVRVTQAGLLSQRQVTLGVIVSFAIASMCGVYLISVAGWPIVAIGIASILSGIAYTGGSWPLGYNGLGDLFVFVFFGLVAVTGTHFVQSGIWSPLALLTALPVGALSTAILVVNNTRDAHTDVKAGKRTLVVRFGVRFGRLEYAALVWGAFAALFAIGHVTQNFGVFAAMLAVPLAIKLTRAMYRIEPGPELNPLLGQTAQLLLVYSALLSMGLLL